MKFRATVQLNGKTVTGIPVPDDVVAALGTSRRPPVRVTFGGHTYRTTVAPLGGVFMVSVSAAARAETGVRPGDDVEIEPDAEPREVAEPADLEAALAAEPEARRLFDRLAYSHRSAYVLWIESAKKDETRQRRILEAVTMLRTGRKQR